ncbi:G-box-binding factor-like [Saccostrea echinata]|uniref:G-box-binding factor-like n=1 Tax=Saccostrea echinata TaxID=191078 RepID=UPI002A822B33|nr:G-box-binding factor-like [Saccostrea echinata]
MYEETRHQDGHHQDQEDHHHQPHQNQKNEETRHQDGHHQDQEDHHHQPHQNQKNAITNRKTQLIRKTWTSISSNGFWKSMWMKETTRNEFHLSFARNAEIMFISL